VLIAQELLAVIHPMTATMRAISGMIPAIRFNLSSYWVLWEFIKECYQAGGQTGISSKALGSNSK
jgi:hypothetical protein